MVTSTGDDILDRLGGHFSGDLIRPGAPDYDELRAGFNAMVDKRPALIARCHTTEDVVAAVNSARENRFELAVRSGGHAVTGASSSDGGLVVDLRPMKTVAVDPARPRARVGAGATWSDFDAATQEYGLATTGGRVSTTGVSGLTLGGGSGWLERRYGLACDNLASAEVVTADGRVLTASETSNPDLFWALHGGGGNFGVVTSLEFRLHPVGPTVLAGLLLWPAAAGRDLMRFYRNFAGSAPDELGSAAAFITGPSADFIPKYLRGTICAAVALCHCGPVGEGEEVVKALRSFGPPDADLVHPMPFGSGGVYLNFIGDEGEDRVRAAYGDHYARLVEIKAKYDPGNLFHLNQNIKP
jgi:FAD/FMN-containing dehydrogenase